MKQDNRLLVGTGSSVAGVLALVIIGGFLAPVVKHESAQTFAIQQSNRMIAAAPDDEQEAPAENSEEETPVSPFRGAPSVGNPGVKAKPVDTDMPVATIEKGTKSGIKTVERVCINEEADFLSLWRRHRTGSLKSDPAPSVDFEHNMVVAVFQGENATDSGFIEIASVKLLPDKVLVITKQSDDSNPKSASDRSTTASFHIAKTTKSALPVSFE